MELSIFTQISLVIAISAAVSLLMRVLRQPLILGSILTGIAVGPSALNIVHARDAFETFSQIGIALLLFIIGLGLNAGVIRSLGKVSLATSMMLLVLVGFSGHLLSLAMGFNNISGIFLGIALFFSSTIIVLKVLSDKHELDRLYGQVSIGVLLLEDVIAIMAMVAIAMLSSGNGDAVTLSILGIKALLLGVGLYVSSQWVIPRIAKSIAKSSELLFLFSIGWGLSVASLFELAGLSHEIGALFAGVSLAGLPYATEMGAKLKPLRDFFIVLFFVTLGELFTFGALQESLLPALILSLLVVLGKPLFVMISLGLLRYTRLTSFKAAIHLSQVSEFSIIMIVFGAAHGIVEQSAVPVITLVGLITIALSTYLMKYDDRLYKVFEKKLRIFERKSVKEVKQRRVTYPVILFGYHNGGHEFVETFRDMNLRYLVIDYNPEIIEHLEHRGIRHAYGDMTDEELLNEINVAKAELVISTIDDIRTNIVTLRFLRRHNPDASFICHAKSYQDAAELYEHGASYVSLPHFIGSERVSNFIRQHGMSHEALKNYRDKHLITIGRRALDAVN
ncbi:cation:proton antiporter [Candidatus Saccharibacteria bacterium]|nr:cation:proton antiporter [Candidatus Saccharibacteria bacterium]